MVVMGDGLKSEQHFCVVSSAVDTWWYRTTVLQACVSSKIISKKFQDVPAASHVSAAGRRQRSSTKSTYHGYEYNGITFCKKFIPFIYYLFIPFIYYLSGMNLLNYFSTVVFVFRCAVFIALNSHL